jgi:hypothetical protein
MRVSRKAAAARTPARSAPCWKSSPGSSGRADGNATIKGAKLGPCVPARPWAVAHFSASVVAARLLNLPSEAIVAAQGIAASTASGVQVFLEEGAWTKRMHPGWAAVAGITAARLAQHGFKAPTRPL